MIRLGPHTTRLDSPIQQRAAAIENKWSAYQTHWANPRTIRTASTPKDIPVKDLDPKKDPVWAFHCAYPAFAAPLKDEKATANYLARVLESSSLVGAQFVVVHVGETSVSSAKEVADRMRNFLRKNRFSDITLKLSEKFPVKLVVENVAAKYEFNQSLIHLIEVIEEFPGIGWCLDTAHSNAAGIPWDEVRTIITEFPPDLAHINFPGSPFGCGRDRHGWRSDPTILAGEINEDCDLTPEDVKEWDDTVRLLHKEGVPLILEGSGWRTSDILTEIDFVRNLLQKEETSDTPTTKQDSNEHHGSKDQTVKQ